MIHQNLQSKIAQLDSELRTMLAHRYYGPKFDQKEREIDPSLAECFLKLKEELDKLIQKKVCL